MGMQSALLRRWLVSCSGPRPLSLLNNNSNNHPEAPPVRAGRKAGPRGGCRCACIALVSRHAEKSLRVPFNYPF